MKTARTLAFFAIIVLFSAGALTARTWKEAGSDRSFEGDFVKVDGENVVIRMASGSTVNVPVARFSEEDQAFVKSQGAPAPAPTSESADDEVVLSGVHLCCGGCEKGVDTALADIEGVEYDVNRTAKSITFKGPKTLEALEALSKKGYYGESSSKTIKIADAKAPDKKTDSVAVTGVHLCCGACVKAIDKAMAEVEGFKSHNAAKNSPAFTVEGDDITAIEVLTALRAKGFSGIVQ